MRKISGVKAKFKIPMGVKRSIGILKTPSKNNLVGRPAENKIIGKQGKKFGKT
jgi:hypothetical protein